MWKRPVNHCLTGPLRRLLRWSGLLLLALALGACARPPALPEFTVPTWPFAGPTPTPGPRTVSLLGWSASPAENRVLQEAILNFEATHPHLRVRGLLAPDYPDVLETAFLDGEPPDLFLLAAHQLADYAAAERIRPLPAGLAASPDLPPALAAGLTVNGVPYCLPREIATLAVYINPRLFARKDVALPQPGWTWEDFATAARATTDANFGLFGLALTRDLSRLHTFLLQATTDDTAWTGDHVRPTLEFLTALYADGVAVEPGRVDSTWNGEAFGRGKVAMTVEGPWLRPFLEREFPLLRYEVMELPAGPARRASTAFVTCWVVSAAAPDPEAAFTLAAYLASPAVTLPWADAAKSLPPNRTLAAQWGAANPDYAPFVAALDTAVPWTGGTEFTNRVTRLNRLLPDAADDLDNFTAALAQLAED